MKSLFEQRKKNFIDATSFVEPEKIPVGIEMLTWPFVYAGTTYKNVINDPQKTADAYEKFLEVADVDFLCGGSITYPIRAFEELDIDTFVFAKDDTCIQHQQTKEEMMRVEEYPELIADPQAFKEKLAKRKIPAFQLPRKEAYKKLKSALKQFKIFSEANALISDKLQKKHEVLSLMESTLPLYTNPFNTIHDSLRGITESLIDLRRRPQDVFRACDALWEQQLVNFNFDPKDYTEAFPPAFTFYHSEAFISPEFYDKLFFQKFKKTYLPFMEAGTKFFLKGEGHFIKTLDRFRQLPRGAMIIMIDEDDPFEVYKEIGDWATIAAGIKVDLLQVGSKQQCIDYVKKCFDTFGPGGGFIFMPNKPLMGAGDAKIENLKAVYKVANELSKK